MFAIGIVMAPEAVEAIMVGRTLTLDRVRQLNAKDYFYQMLKDNPEILKIHPGIENELLKGAIDCHIHAYPDFVHRSQDMIQIAVDASKAGMRALAFKDHWNVSANAAFLAQRHIDYLVEKGELTHRVEIYGGAGTCLGMNPEAIRIAACSGSPFMMKSAWLSRSSGICVAGAPKKPTRMPCRFLASWAHSISWR